MSNQTSYTPTRLIIGFQNRWRLAMSRARTHSETGEGVVNYILVIAAVVVIAAAVFPILQGLIVDEANDLDMSPLDG